MLMSSMLLIALGIGAIVGGASLMVLFPDFFGSLGGVFGQIFGFIGGHYLSIVFVISLLLVIVFSSMRRWGKVAIFATTMIISFVLGW